MDNPGFLSPSSQYSSSTLRMIAPHETLESIFLSNKILQTPKRDDVFNRLFFDSAIRRKNREISINSLQKSASKTKVKTYVPGDRIEDILIRKGKELNLKKQRLIDRIEEERNKHIRPVPEINPVSKMLANTDYVNRYYSGGPACSHRQYGSHLRNYSRQTHEVSAKKTRPSSAAQPKQSRKEGFASPKHVELALDFDEDTPKVTAKLSDVDKIEAEKLYYEALKEAERLSKLISKPDPEPTTSSTKTPTQKENLDFSQKVETQKLLLEKLQNSAPFSFGNSLLEPEDKEAYLQPSEPVREEMIYSTFIKPLNLSGEGLSHSASPTVNMASPPATARNQRSSSPHLTSFNSLKALPTIEIPDSATDRYLSPRSPPIRAPSSQQGEATSRSAALRPYLLDLKSTSNISIERSAILKQSIIARKKLQQRKKSRR